MDDDARLAAYWLLSSPGARGVRSLSFEKPIAALDADDSACAKFAQQWASLGAQQREQLLDTLVDALRLPGALAVSGACTFYLVEQIEDLADITQRSPEKVADAFAHVGSSTTLVDLIAFASMYTTMHQSPFASPHVRRALFELIIEPDAPRPRHEALHRAVYALFGFKYDERDIAVAAAGDTAQQTVSRGVRGGGGATDADRGLDDDDGDKAASDYAVPTLIARHIARRLSPSDRQALMQVSRNFASLIRDDSPEIYRAAVDELYPAFARLFSHSLPPWLDFGAADRPSKLAAALNDKVEALVAQEVVLSSELSSPTAFGTERAAQLARLDKLRADLSLARALLNELSVANRLDDNQYLNSTQRARVGETRSWQLLLRSLNAIATHPAVRRELLQKNFSVAYTGAPIIVDASEFAALGLEAPTYRRGLTTYQRNTGAYYQYPVAATPLLLGRYYVFDLALLKQRNRQSLLGNVDPSPNMLVEMRHINDDEPVARWWHVYRPSDALDNFEVVHSSSVEPTAVGPRGIERAFTLSTHAESDARLMRYEFRPIAAAKWQEVAASDPMEFQTHQAGDWRLLTAIGAVDELLLTALEAHSANVTALQ
jgi:hypothetical protein